MTKEDRWKVGKMVRVKAEGICDGCPYAEFKVIRYDTGAETAEYWAVCDHTPACSRAVEVDRRSREGKDD